MKALITLFGLCLSLSGQTTVYLRSTGPAGTYVIGTSGSGVSPFHLLVKSTAGLSVGDTISVVNVCANNGTTYLSSANGIRKIAAVNSGTDLTITDQAGGALTSNGNWCDGTNPISGYGGGPQYIGKLTPFPLVAGQPRGWFDGPNGPVTRKWALGTQNGLTSLVCASNVCTVTTNFGHGVMAGNHITVWGTTNSTLNNGRVAAADYVVNSGGLTATQFSFNASGVPDGTYTTNATCGPGATPNGTIQGTDNCVRISQLATLNNPTWALLFPNVQNAVIPNGSYKSIADSANGILGISDPFSVAQSYWGPISTLFLVDQSNASALSALMYILKNLHRLGGANFNSMATAAEAGNGELGDFGSYVWEQLGVVYSAGSPYLTSADKATALARIYNDLGDATPCTISPYRQQVLASGAAVAGSSTTITLAADPGHGDNYFVNNVVGVAVGGGYYSYGLITSYVAATKVATVASWSYLTPSAGMAYSVYATITRSGNTITGYNTTFTTQVGVGDVVYGGNAFPGLPTRSGSYITAAVSSNTSLTVRNGSLVNAGSIPQTYWYASQPTGNATCGLKWAHNNWVGSPTASPATYPTYGGGLSAVQANQPAVGSNNAYTFTMGATTMDLVAADDDPRAVIDLAAVNTFYWDYQMAMSMTLTTGYAQSGSHYSFARTLSDAPATAWVLARSVPTYPALDPGGPWESGPSILKQYTALPDTPNYSGQGLTWFPALWGAAAGNFITSAGGAGQAGENYVRDAGTYFAPTQNSSQYFQSWLTSHSGYSWDAGVSTGDLPLKLDPRNPTTPYTAQPFQYLFTATSWATCTALFGTCPYPQNLRADAWISRTGWSSNTDTFLQVESRSSVGDHDSPDPGALQLYRAGYLLAPDEIPVGGIDNGAGAGGDATKIGTAFEFGAADTLKPTGNPVVPGQWGIANVTRWSSANSGPFPTAYGDQNSNYACATMDFKGMYTTTYNAVLRTICDFKKAGTEHMIVQYDYVDASNSPVAIRNQLHYPQNGEHISTAPLVFYDEGTTTCPGTGGCASLDTNRQILEQENGATGPAGTPNRVYNLITRFLTPAGAPTYFLHFDGTSFTGSYGHTNRVSICADAFGTGTCGSASQSKLEDLIVHKIATQPDTVLTTTALNPDAKWTGVQATGATDTKIFLMARGGQLQPSPTTFTTAFTGTAQWVVSGLTPGTYTVTVGGNTVLNGRTVASGDNSLYFESAAGAVTISPGGVACLIGTTMLPPGSTGAAYSTFLQTSGCAAPVTWGITAGSLCAGLSLGTSTGIISGTPSTAQVCNFTVQASDSGGNSPSQALSLTVTSSAAQGTTFSGGTVSAGTIRH